ncbi:hypothetical protein J3E69DRAFT_344532 [Trichoderma sp. SZMC 28015]
MDPCWVFSLYAVGCSVLLLLLLLLLLRTERTTTISVSTAAGDGGCEKPVWESPRLEERIAGSLEGVRVTRSVELSLWTGPSVTSATADATHCVAVLAQRLDLECPRLIGSHIVCWLTDIVNLGSRYHR